MALEKSQDKKERSCAKNIGDVLKSPSKQGKDLDLGSWCEAQVGSGAEKIFHEIYNQPRAFFVISLSRLLNCANLN